MVTKPDFEDLTDGIKRVLEKVDKIPDAVAYRMTAMEQRLTVMEQRLDKADRESDEHGKAVAALAEKATANRRDIDRLQKAPRPERPRRDSNPAMEEQTGPPVHVQPGPPTQRSVGAWFSGLPATTQALIWTGLSGAVLGIINSLWNFGAWIVKVIQQGGANLRPPGP